MKLPGIWLVVGRRRGGWRGGTRSLPRWREADPEESQSLSPFALGQWVSLPTSLGWCSLIFFSILLHHPYAHGFKSYPIAHDQSMCIFFSSRLTPHPRMPLCNSLSTYLLKFIHSFLHSFIHSLLSVGDMPASVLGIRGSIISNVEYSSCSIYIPAWTINNKKIEI